MGTTSKRLFDRRLKIWLAGLRYDDIAHAPIVLNRKFKLNIAREVCVTQSGRVIRTTILSILGVDESRESALDAPMLVFDTPKPEAIQFKAANVVFTGEFHMGRGSAEELATALGATVQEGTNQQTTYVIVGDIPNPTWRFKKYGTKVMRALKLRETGYPISIISEDTFCAAVPEKVLKEKLESIPTLKVEGFIITRGSSTLLKHKRWL